MSATEKDNQGDFILPASVATKLDLSHLLDDLERVDGELTAITVRSKVSAVEQTEPALSKPLADFLAQNQLDLQNTNERSRLIRQLRQLKNKAPVINMTFPSFIDRESLQQIAGWLRSSIHPQAVVEVGLQPALVAGVYLRTPNQVFDLSLRRFIEDSHDDLVKQLETVRGEG